MADSGNHAIRKISPAGEVTTLAGVPGRRGNRDGASDQALFAWPCGIVRSGDGTLYIADTDNRTVRKITPGGIVLTVAGGSGGGSADGSGRSARLDIPLALALDRQGNVIVGCSHTVRKLSQDGVVTTLAGKAIGDGDADGSASVARFRWPVGIAVDASDRIYVGEFNGPPFRRIEPNGSTSTLKLTYSNSGSSDGRAEPAFVHGAQVAVDAKGNLICADFESHVIRKVTPSGEVSTLAGMPGISGYQDGTGSAARFLNPNGIAIDPVGNIWVQDRNCTIRKISAQGKVTPVAGDHGVRGWADGRAGEARFHIESALTVDRAGNVYVAEKCNQRIRKITPEGLVTTIAGCGVPGYVDGPAAKAQFNEPYGIAVDSDGNIYVTDIRNNVVRMISTDGMVTTVGGAAPGVATSEDALGEEAKFSSPFNIAIDSRGNLFVADHDNNRIVKGTPLRLSKP